VQLPERIVDYSAKEMLLAGVETRWFDLYWLFGWKRNKQIGKLGNRGIKQDFRNKT